MRVLYISYNGLSEPLGRTQVIPYVRALAHSRRFVLISFEKVERDGPAAREATRTLLGSDVQWLPQRYHRRPTLPATAWDALWGTLRGLLAGPVDLVHARSTVAALMAWSIARLRRRPWIFDVRGLLAQEYVDGHHWPADGALARLTAAIEGRLLFAADGLVLLTHKIEQQFREQGRFPASRPVAVIPCAVDIRRFVYSPKAAASIRRQLGFGSSPVMVYAGSLGSWYLPSEMIEFFTVARGVLPDLRFLVLSPQASLMEGEAARRGVAGFVHTQAVAAEAVPDYLSAADFGISFIAPSPSKLASSPTKLGEYLACGLPVVLNAGVGDVDELEAEYAWVLLPSLDKAEYLRAAKRVKHLLADPARRNRARDLAQARFSLNEAVRRYDDLYRRVARQERIE